MNNPSQNINKTNEKQAKGRSFVESEDTYRKLYEDAPIAYFSIGADNIIKNCNNATSNLLGYTKAELLEKSFIDLYADTPDGLPKARELFIQFLKGKMIRNKELQMKRKNGEVIWISLTVNPIINDKGNIVESRSMVVNITERKKSEHKLIESEKKYRELFNNIYTSVAVYEAIDDGNDFIFKYFNLAAEKVENTKKEELIGKSVVEKFPGVKEFGLFDVFQRVWKTGIPEHHPISIYRDERIYGWRENYVYKLPTGEIIAVYEDVTNEKLREIKLKESEEKYRNLSNQYEMLLESITDGIFALNSDWEYILVNKSAEDINNISRDKIIGRRMQDLFPGIEDTPFFKIYESVMNNRNEERIIESFTHPDGKTKFYDLSVYPIHQGILCISKDVTEERKIQQELEESEEKYRSAYNRSNLYKDIFTHDINNILQNILSSLELSKIYSQSNDKSKEFEEVTSLINEQVIRGKKLVKNVQNLSQVEEGKNEIYPTDALQVINKTSAVLKENFHDKNIKIEINSSLNEYFVGTNKLLKNIFENILYNAVYHNKNNVINISVNVSEISKNNTNYVKFEISDNGVGIPDSMKGNIFSREYKEGEIPTGIGLGLLLVKRILENYGGEISVEDRIIGDHNQGSKFIILIPEK